MLAANSFCFVLSGRECCDFAIFTSTICENIYTYPQIKMPARRRVSERQMELLLEFAETHRDIAMGRFPGGPQAVRVVREAWDSVAVQLNSIAEGINKTPDKWRRYWIEFKAKTKAKAADSRRNASGTGGGPNMLVPLNDIEERVMALIGPVAVEGLPGVRLHIDIPEEPAASAIPHSPSPEPEYVEWLEEEIQSPSQPATQPLSSPSPSTETQPADTPDIPRQIDEQPEVSSREHRQARRSAPPASQPARRQRSQRQTRRDERVPRWAYDIEMRRIAAEERHVTAMEAMVDLIKQIRDDIQTYVHRTG